VPRSGAGLQARIAIGPEEFRPLGLDFATYTFERKGGAASRAVLKQFTAEVSFYRLDVKLAPKLVPPAHEEGEARIAAPPPREPTAG
jgi:hypothetical protein